MLARFFLPLLALALMGSAKKPPAIVVRFHFEANARDTGSFATPVTLQYPPRQAFMEKIPAITERDIAAIYPFPAGDGTAGCAFQLTEHGRFALETLSTERRGTSVVVIVNTRQVIDIQIDKRVADGIITIPRNLAAAEIVLLQKQFPTVGQPKKKRR